MRKNSKNMSIASLLGTMNQTTTTGRTGRLHPDIAALLIYPSTDMANEPITIIEHMNTTDLRHWLQKPNLPAYFFVQKFILPQGEHNSVYKVNWSGGGTSTIQKIQSVHRVMDRRVTVAERGSTHEGNKNMVVSCK